MDVQSESTALRDVVKQSYRLWAVPHPKKPRDNIGDGYLTSRGAPASLEGRFFLAANNFEGEEGIIRCQYL